MGIIWKYTLQPSEMQYIQMPERALVLSAQEQDGEVRVWALVEPDAPLELVTFYTYGTGHIVPDIRARFLSTVQIGSLVFHVFTDSHRVV